MDIIKQLKETERQAAKQQLQESQQDPFQEGAAL